ncbi:glutaredoxin domain-containing protein, partial [Clostridium perfringens]|uniref:glutaredoxin domain-containing protein n=1 Tax=Clostridium perfringens TaxID=1502 RepID=UPI001FAAB22B
MRKITKIVFIFILLFNLVGCIEGNYLRDTSKGSIVEIKLDDAILMAEKEESIILFTQSTCKDCINLKKILIPYLENHKVNIHEVVLDNEGTSKEEIQNNRKNINKVFPEFDSTPSMYNCLLYTSPSPRDMRRSRMPCCCWFYYVWGG